MNRIEVTDYSTLIDKAFWDEHQDNIEEAVATCLSLSGGIMTGEITFASGQQVDGGIVTITDPLYPHTGIYSRLNDHINDPIQVIQCYLQAF